MASVDKRIVDLQFNNAQFAKGVESTIKSLDDLNRNLDNTGASGSGLEKLRVGFDALDVVGMTVISNLTNAAIDLGKTIVNYAAKPFDMAINQIVTGGINRAKNIENAEFLLGGLFGDEQVMNKEAGKMVSKVDWVMDNALESVSGTAYGLDQAAKAAAQFAASGIEAGEPMVQVLKGVAGVAALTNSEFDDISKIFTNVAGTGRVTRNELNSLAMRGINPFILLAEHMGTSVTEVQEILSSPDANISAKTFFATFEQFADHATKANETFSGSLSNLRSALSRIGAVVAQPGLEMARNVFNELREVVNALNKSLKPVQDALISMMTNAAGLDKDGNPIGWLVSSLRDLSTMMNEGGGIEKLSKIFTNVLSTMQNVGKGISSVFSPIKDAFQEIFPPATLDTIINLTANIANLTSNFRITDATAEKLKRTFAGVFALLDIAKDVVITVAKGFGTLLSFLSPVGDALLTVTAFLGDLIVRFREGASAGDVFNNALDGFKSFLETIGTGIQWAIDKISNQMSRFGGIDLGPLKIFSDETKTMFNPVLFIVETAQKAFDGLRKAFEWLGPFLSELAPNIKKGFQAVGDAITNVLNYIGFEDIRAFVQFLLDGSMTGAIIGLVKKLDLITGKINGMGGLTGVLIDFRKSLAAYQAELKAKSLIKIAGAIAILAGAMWILSTIPADALGPSVAAMTSLFGQLVGSMAILSKSAGSPIKITLLANAMVAMGTSLVIMAAAMKILSTMNPDELAMGVAAMAGMLAELVLAALAMSKVSLKIFVVAQGMISMATAMVILAEAVRKVGQMNPDEILKGITGIAGMLAVVAGFMAIMPAKSIIGVGFALIMLSTGMVIMSNAIANIAKLSWEDLAKGLISIAAVLAAVAGATKLTNPAAMLAMGAAMIGVGIGLNTIALAVMSMGSMNWDTLLKGLIGLAAVMGFLIGVTKLIDPVSMLALGVSLVGVGIGMNLMATSLMLMGSMSWESMAIGLLALGGSLAILAGAALLMNTALPGAAAMVVMALAIAMLVPPLMLLGAMSLKSVGVMLLALAGVFAVFAVSALLMTPVVPIMLGVAAAMALLGAGVFLLGAGLFLLAAAMASVAVGGVAFAGALSVVLTAIIDLIPYAVSRIGIALIQLLDVLIEAMPKIFEVLRLLLSGLIALLWEYMGPILEVIGVLILKLLEMLITYTPIIVEAIVLILIGILRTLTSYIPEIIVAAIQLLIGFVDGIIQSIPLVVGAILRLIEALLVELLTFIPRLVDIGFNAITQFMDGMATTLKERVPEFVDTAMDMMEAIVDGLAYAIETSGPRLREMAERLGEALWNGFKGFFGINSPSKLAEDGGGFIIQGIINGLTNGVQKVKDTIVDVAKSVWNGFKDFFGIKSPSTLMETEGGNVIAGVDNGLKNGEKSLGDRAKEVGSTIFSNIKNAVENVGDVAKNVVGTLGDGLKNGLEFVGDSAKEIGGSILSGIKGVLGINSPAKTMIEAAHFTGQGLIVGLKQMNGAVVGASEDLGSGVVDGVRSSLFKMGELLNEDVGLQPVITPVIDLTDVRRDLDSTFENQRMLDISASRDQVSKADPTQTVEPRLIPEDPDTTTDGPPQPTTTIYQYNTVRNDTDIRKINSGLDDLFVKTDRAKGVKPTP